MKWRIIKFHRYQTQDIYWESLFCYYILIWYMIHDTWIHFYYQLAQYACYKIHCSIYIEVFIIIFPLHDGNWNERNFYVNANFCVVNFIKYMQEACDSDNNVYFFSNTLSIIREKSIYITSVL